MMFMSNNYKKKTTLPAIIKFLKLTDYYTNPVTIRLTGYTAHSQILDRYCEN